jgi:acetyl esterase
MPRSLKTSLLRRYYRALNAWAWRRAERPPVLSEEREIPGPGGTIGLRIYRPAGAEAKRTVLYFHGGGWVLGDLETHRPFCEQLCANTRSEVVAVDYRRAPEAPFPAAVDDCVAAASWLVERDGGTEQGPVYVGGDSAGGNLTAVAVREVEGIAGQLLFYPAVAHYESDFPSYTQYGRQLSLPRSQMIWFWDCYLAGQAPEDAAERSAPLGWDDHSGLPPALVITAEMDALKDEGIAFAAALSEAGVPMEHWHFERARHGFLCSEGLSTAHREAMKAIRCWFESLETS